MTSNLSGTGNRAKRKPNSPSATAPLQSGRVYDAIDHSLQGELSNQLNRAMNTRDAKTKARFEYMTADATLPNPALHIPSASGAIAKRRRVTTPAAAVPVTAQKVREKTAQKTHITTKSVTDSKTKVKKPKIQVIAATKVTPLPIGILAMSLIATLLIMFIIINFVQINEYTREVTTLKAKVSSLTQQEKELMLELEKRDDLRVIEEKAVALGMVKKDTLPKKYIILESEDKIEVTEKAQQETSADLAPSSIMSIVGETFHKIKEYLS